MEVRGTCLIFLLVSATTCLPNPDTLQRQGVPLTKSFHPPLTQDRYSSGMLGHAQEGMTLHQNALLPLLLVNPDFLKLYTENPSLASQYVTLLMHVGSLRANNNDCPAISRSCPAECYSISSTGCIVCQCPTSHGSAPSSTTSNSTHTGSSASSSTAGNNNGCPPFPSQCDPNCLALDSMGCPICSCPKTHQTGTHTLASSGSGGSPTKVNGCAPFPKNCSAECAHIDAMGCIVCSCPTGSSTQNGNNTSSSSSSSSSQGNINGCQPFPKSCQVECAMVDARGCIVCKCPSTGSSNSTSAATQTATSGGNGINGCPPFPKNCDSSCVTLNDMGCVICSCSPSGNNSTQTQTHQIGNYVSVQGQGSSGNGNGCPALDPKCPTECSAIDSHGCVRCTCQSGSATSSSAQSGSVSSSNAGGCPAIPKNCHVTCLNIDASGCVVCSCPSNTGVSGYGATCPPYNADDCDDVCKVTDTHCPICDCSQHFSGPQSTTPGPITSVPGAGGCPSFDFSTCDPNCVVMDAQGCMSCSCTATTTAAPSGGQSKNTSGTVTGVPGAGGCPSFDFSTCDPNCVVMDGRGCLSCTCAATTASPSGGQSTTAGAVTSVPGAGGCPSFDFSTCDPKCVVMDAQGCMTCSCSATTRAPSTGNNSSTAVPGAGGCPSFDFSTCDPNCVVMDAQGCMSCQCTATTSAPSGQSSSASVTSVPGAGGCPSFDFSTCDPSCVVMDPQGCMSCQCQASTVAPLIGQSTTSGAVTSVPGAGGCPSFDFSTCDPNCVVMDAQGCISCHCAATKTTAPPGQSTQQPGTTTSVPGAGGCPSFDFSKCDPNCVVMDSQGCLTCSCAVTAPAPSGSTAASVTSVPGAGGCPSFDFSKCDPNCVVMDSQGCMTCSCSGNQSGRLTIAPPPNTTTRRPTTATRPTSAPRITTTYAPPTTTGNTCPPIRCTYPCDLGVAFNGSGCPVCKCRTSTAAP